MPLVKDILRKTEKTMTFKEINYFDNLSVKEIRNFFYPQMIFSFAKKTNYPLDESNQLAYLSQLLFYSIQLHDKILVAEDEVGLLVLEGDHLFSLVFEEITSSSQIEHTLKFTNYIKDLSEKRILALDGSLDVELVEEFKFQEVARIITQIVGKNDPQLLELSKNLSYLLRSYLKEDSYQEDKDAFFDNYFLGKDSQLEEMALQIIEAMEGEIIEKK